MFVWLCQIGMGGRCLQMDSVELSVSGWVSFTAVLNFAV